MIILRSETPGAAGHTTAFQNVSNFEIQLCYAGLCVHCMNGAHALGATWCTCCADLARLAKASSAWTCASTSCASYVSIRQHQLYLSWTWDTAVLWSFLMLILQPWTALTAS